MGPVSLARLAQVMLGIDHFKMKRPGERRLSEIMSRILAIDFVNHQISFFD